MTRTEIRSHVRRSLRVRTVADALRGTALVGREVAIVYAVAGHGGGVDGSTLADLVGVSRPTGIRLAEACVRYGYLIRYELVDTTPVYDLVEALCEPADLALAYLDRDLASVRPLGGTPHASP